MVKAPYIDKNGMKKGAWSEDEDNKLRAYIERYGHWNWRELPKYAGLTRCGKSCRLRWLNYLRPNIKRGGYTKEEEDLIIELHKSLGNKWSAIAAKLPGRSDNEIKNYWHTNLKKRSRKPANVTGNEHIRKPEPCEAGRKGKTLQKPESCENDRQGKTLKTFELTAIDEVKILLAVLSSGTASSSSFSSSSTELSSSLSSSGSDCVVSKVGSSQPSDCMVSNVGSSQQPDCEHFGDFWTESFVSETDSIKLDENFLSPLEFDSSSFSPATEPAEMMVVDDFFWSTVDLYCEYDTWLMN